MKGLILSGGKGTRLRPITHTSAKQLIPVANKPILFYGIEAMRFAGILEIGIIVGQTRNEIVEAVGSGERWGVQITYIDQPEPLGLAHAVKTACAFLKGDPFVMYLGDNLLKCGISHFVEEFQKSGAHAQILLAKVPNPQDFGVAQLSGDQVVRLVEKPKHPPSDLALVGVYMFDSHIFKAVEKLKPSARGELEITDAIQWLIDQGFEVSSHQVTGWWKDTGKREDLLEANRLACDALETHIDGDVDSESSIYFKVVIEKGAVVRRSKIRGPAIIGKDTLIEDAFIGPFTAIADQCDIRECEIEDSILLDHTVINQIAQRISGSVIGRHVRISHSKERPAAISLLLGENCHIDL
ncbi:MAG: glucose-1-phosphate thymidylyltransferase [Deltaproteobacteria bacterium]|nr:glucose-1-phosphate thymidylyltransferase [Deltaproteobacteria bacterium]